MGQTLFLFCLESTDKFLDLIKEVHTALVSQRLWLRKMQI